MRGTPVGGGRCGSSAPSPRASRPCVAQLGRLEHLGVVEEAEHERPEGRPVGDGHLEHHRAVVAVLGRDRLARAAGRPRGLVGDRRAASPSPVAVAQAPRLARGRRPAPPRAVNAPGLARRTAPSMRSRRKLRSPSRRMVEAGEVPASPLVVEAVGAPPCGPRRGSENVASRRSAQACAARAGRDRRAAPPAPRRWPAPSRLGLDHAAQLPQALEPSTPIEAHRGGGQVQGGQLVGLEARIAEVVAGPGRCGSPRSGGSTPGRARTPSGMPISRRSSLSRSKARRKAGLALGVPGHALAHLLGGQRARASRAGRR